MVVPDKLISVINGPIFWLPVTLVIYAASTALYRRYNKAPLLNPTLLTIACIAPVLIISAVPYQKYFEAVAVLHYLLGTAVVALALPLYKNLKRLQGRCMTMTLALFAGSLASILVGLAIATLAGASAFAILSLAPKSATAAVSMEIARLIGGAPAVTGVLTILTGIIGAVAGPYVLDLAQIRTPEARGFALGIASHGIATARAFSEGEIAGSFAGLGMALNAVLTAMVVPLVVRAFGLVRDRKGMFVGHHNETFTYANSAFRRQRNSFSFRLVKPRTLPDAVSTGMGRLFSWRRRLEPCLNSNLVRDVR